MKEYIRVDANGTWKIEEQASGVVVEHLVDASQEYIDRVLNQPIEIEPEGLDLEYARQKLDELESKVKTLEDNAGLAGGEYVANYWGAKDNNPQVVTSQPYPDDSINRGIDYGMATTDLIIILLLTAVLIVAIWNKARGQLWPR